MRSLARSGALLIVWMAGAALGSASPKVAPKAVEASAPAVEPAFGVLSPRVVAYRIEARLDPARQTVTGSEIVTYRNDSTETLKEIPFHLYPNAFSSDRTLYARETLQEEGPHAPLEKAIREKGWGWMKVVSVALEGGEDLAASTTIDETVMRVPLPEPLAPGGSVALRIAWELKLPRIIARMGFWGDHFAVMQWFPKPGVYRDGAWNVHPFHAHSEFFADFATFDVTLTVPQRFKLEATGVRTSEKENGDGTRSFTYHADDVHDFAWVADPNARIARTKSGGVEIVFFHQPHHAEMAPRILAVAQECLKWYGEWYLPYPYPRIVIVDNPMGLGGGMEYPMLFTVSTAWFLPGWYVGPESVTAHEFGHEYWYGIVATNEFEEPWLDEGINTYSTLRLMDAAVLQRRPGATLTAMAQLAVLRVLAGGIPLDLGFREFNLNSLLGFTRTPFQETKPTFLGYPLNALNASLPGLTSGPFLAQKDGYVRHGTEDPIESAAWEYYPGDYANTVYSKTAVVLETLERKVGPEKMGRILKEYATRNAFSHPKAEAFVSVASEVAGEDLHMFFDQFVFGTEKVDFAVGPVTSELVHAPAGFQPAQRVGTDALDLSRDKGTGKRYETEVVVRRLGGVVLPVDVVVTFEDGTSVRERWDAATRWHRYSYLQGSKLRSVVLDPNRVYALDVNFNNNSYTPRSQCAAVRKLSTIWLFWLQNYLHLASSLF